MSDNPHVESSVIIPCWNVAPWLPRCLEEVFAALPPAAEVIAVDDGSDDATGEILERFAAAHPELKVFTQPNAGVSAARNRALGASSGEFIFFVDPDDGVEPDFFTSILERMRETGADYCVSGYRTRCDDGSFNDVRLKRVYEFSSKDEIIAGYISRIIGYSFDDVRRLYHGTPLFERREMAFVWRAAFRRSVIESRGIRFDETVVLCEDAVFNAEYLLSAKVMTCIDRPLYRMTVRANGATASIPRDATRFCRNKLRLLEARKRLDEASGGRLWKLCEASAVFSALEILSLMVRKKLAWREGRRILKEYLCDERVRAAVRDFPLSWRKPFLASAVGILRLFFSR